MQKLDKPTEGEPEEMVTLIMRKVVEEEGQQGAEPPIIVYLLM
jgi:hypothetical protein